MSMSLQLGLSLSSTLVRGGGRPEPWEETLAALKAYLAAHDGLADNPHDNAKLTIGGFRTSSGASGGSLPSAPDNGLTALYTQVSNPELFRFTCGGNKALDATRRQFPASTQAASTGGNLSDGTNGFTYHSAIRTNAAKIGLRTSLVTTVSPSFRLIVSGKYCDVTEPATVSPLRWAVWDLGSSATRDIIIEADRALAFDRIALAPADTIEAPPIQEFRLAVISDSFGEGVVGGAGNTIHWADSFTRVMADYLGIDDCWPLSVGGTGYVAGSSGTKYNLVQRLEVDIDRFLSFAKPGQRHVYVIPNGLNDVSLVAGNNVLSAASFVYSLIRSKDPAGLILVDGPWDKWAPGGRPSGYGQVVSSIQTAAAPIDGAFYLGLTAGLYFANSNDGTHPNDAAEHYVVGKGLADGVRSFVASA